VHTRVDRGDSLADALADSGEFFPPMFLAMVHVGEATGKLAESLLRLAEHYEHGLALRRTFLAGITWPVIQLVATVGIVGFLIWIVGVIGSVVGETRDLLGLGLTGTSGLLIYLAVVGGITGIVAIVIWSASRGARWTRPFVSATLAIPVLGRALKTIALARCAWALSMTLDSAMDTKRAVRLALASTAMDRYARHASAVEQAIQDGTDIATSLRRTHVFPDDFVDALDVGEQSGQAAESMAALAQQYEQQARAAFSALTVVAGFAVWCAIAALIIAIIFRLALFYIDMINRAASGQF
jgi:type II secretory pathway component PulF